VRLLASLSAVALVTFVGFRLLPINATTQGFAYLLLVLIIASIWGSSKRLLRPSSLRLPSISFSSSQSERLPLMTRGIGSRCSVFS